MNRLKPFLLGVGAAYRLLYYSKSSFDTISRRRIADQFTFSLPFHSGNTVSVSLTVVELLKHNLLP